ncbi:MAG: hypothetical protein DI527_00635 [Chelatococcus sp.]|nr:MAG: hypothetical protein DI527_00635 [Chelatococcus sp.]
MPPRPAPSLDENATPEQVGEASLHCSGYFPECFQTGCQHDGACFRPDGRGYARIRRNLERMLRRAGAAEARWLRVAIGAMEREHDRD